MDQEFSTSVVSINQGTRKRIKMKRRKEIERQNKYGDSDPLGLNFVMPCKHNSHKLQYNRIPITHILNNRKKFFKHHKNVEQDVFLTRLIAPYAPERRRLSKVDGEKRRQCEFSSTYYLNNKGKNLPVCQKLFLQVFSLKKDRVHNIAKTVFEGSIPKEKRGGDRKSAKSIEKKEELKKFLEKLPATESHYNRKKSKRIYLSCGLNQSKLRKIYNESVPTNLQVKKSMFQQVFCQSFNIGFKSPSSDACSTCILLSNKIKREADTFKKRILMVQKRVHNLRAKAFYKLCKKDDPEGLSFCFDLQQVQPLPRTPIQESFYARQISYYNLCFVGMDSKNPKFYQWTEEQGGRGATEVGSALLHYLDTLNFEGKKVLRLFCDGCGGQNKNSHIIHTLMFWLVNNSPENIEEVNLTFPVRGHSFLPADRVFGRVEKHIRTVPVITKKEEYEKIYKEHGTVLRLDHDWTLRNIKSLLSSYKKLPGMRDLKRCNFKKYKVVCGKGQRKRIQTLYEMKCYKNYINESTEERNRFSILKRGQNHPTTLATLNTRRSLTAQKKKDVKALMVKQFGEEWENDEDFKWYKDLLNNETSEYSVETEENDIFEDEECDCMEEEIESVV